MEMIHNDKVMTMVRRALNMIDRRLVDHGVKVMMVQQDMLKAGGCSDKELMKKLDILALLHDVGAYRTEEIDDMVKFEVKNVWQHSIYGYLFLREFTPLGDDLSKVALYHHEDYNRLNDEPEEVRRYAQMLHTADRAVVWHDETSRSEAELKEHLARKRGRTFSPESIDLFCRACKEYGTYSRLDSPGCLETAFVHSMSGETEANAYLAMMVHTIDFRSHVTVTHTNGVIEISQGLARCMGLSEELRTQIYYGALLHDLGKIGIPLSVLEKPGRLTDEEMAVMREHISLGQQIIDGCVDEIVARIALRHHEKLNGSGYPLGLSAAELTLPERLLAVADIASALCMSRSYKEAFPKDKCLAILWDMCGKGQLDREIVTVMENFFDEIMAQADEACEPLREAYARITTEYPMILKEHL